MHEVPIIKISVEVEIEAVRPLLDLIALHESESSARAQGVPTGYDVVANQAFKLLKPQCHITTMNVAEVLSWQRQVIHIAIVKGMKTGYSAAGRYQIIKKTLEVLVYGASAISLSDLFDREHQDFLALTLLKWRGLNQWIRKEISVDSFADNLSKEWASLPYRTGTSYYAGDKHGNKSLVSREQVFSVLSTVRMNYG